MLFVTGNIAHAGLFSDNFNDGTTDGWWLGYSQHTPWIDGNWRVQNGELVQDEPGDNFIGLVEGILISSQTIQIDIKLNEPSGYGGVTIWFQGSDNWVNILVYPAVGETWVQERINGTDQLFRYSSGSIQNNNFFTLKADVDSDDGEIDVFLDGVKIFTHHVVSTNRVGQSGLHNGNAGGHFDNFLISDSIPKPLNNVNQCKQGGWQKFQFKNQGQCIKSLIR
ncbi:MAG: hypothetical protein UU98_C0030G0011 [Parcubacteria group bacterium GW2011_GWD2_42_14]|nr:MAG: hypothetical protein UU98_C0030G0011 [Parcubacteria group bacterium GW2011_GWD2_42_14]